MDWTRDERIEAYGFAGTLNLSARRVEPVLKPGPSLSSIMADGNRRMI